MSTNIDEIWLSLKNSSFPKTSSSSSRAKSISYLWETKKQSCTPSRTNKIKNKKDNKDKQKSNFKHLSISAHIKSDEDEIKENNHHPNEISDEDDVQRDRIIDTRDIDIGDSDDDSDEEDYPVKYLQSSPEEPPISTLKLQRMVSLIKSDSTPQRIDSLKSLLSLIQCLHEKVESKSPILDFPLPYDLSRITLTHRQYDSMVSDLAKGDHVKSWASWQRTKVPITDQFLDNKSKKEDQSSDNESLQHHGNCITTRKSLQIILDFCGLTLFRCFNDTSEVCRSHAIECVKLLCLSNIDVGKHLGFLMPVLLRKYPPVSFDKEMGVFVDDVENHQYYKRGGAINRQDKVNLLSGTQTVVVVDSSEEIRLSLCELLSSIVRCFARNSMSTSLDAYFTDIILAVQSHLKDPFPKVKITAANLLVQILRVPQWELGSKEFATPIARASIQNIRHRNSKVRVSAIYLFETSVSVPNREKIRGAGTTAIVDLIGFREQNVLPIAAFYKHECGVTVNALAELVTDRSTSVRLACCQMLSFLVNCLPDRYEHHQMLLPYLLNFFHDDIDEIRSCANSAIESCGEQYEVENPNDIIERRQYQVDGNEKCNHVDALPFPFTRRPRLGARLFVRNNSKRFFSALLDELTCWVSKTRLQSAKLLSTLIVFNEEHITMDCHNTILGIVKAVQSSLKEHEKESKPLLTILEQILELIGRFIEPQTYSKLLLPRVTGDIDSATTFLEGGAHSESSCIANSVALASMIRGTLPKTLLPYSFNLINTLSLSLSQSYFKGVNVKIQWLNILVTIFDRLKGESFAGAQSACFNVTGRIHSSEEMIKKCKASVITLMNNGLNGEEELVCATAQQLLNQISNIDLKV